MNKIEEQAERLLAFLQKHKDDRGMMADLRCGFSPATAHRAWPHIAPYCQLDLDWSRIPVQTFCAAFATHPKNTTTGNLGDSLKKTELSEGRFKRIISCDSRAELCESLPGLIRFLKAKGVPVNYRQLYLDMGWWEGKYPPKLKWAAAFWGTAGGKQ